MGQLCDRLQIKKTFTPTYNPQLNSVILEREDMEWSWYLGAAILCYNTHVNASTCMTPFKPMLEREARLQVDLIIPTPAKSYHTVNEYVEVMVRYFQEVYTFIRKA